MSQASEAPSAAPAARRPSLLRRFLRTRPWTIAAGPTFQREMRITGRRRSTYLNRAGVTFLMLGLVCLFYMGVNQDLRHQSSDTARLQSLQRIAPAVTLTVLWFQFAVISFLAPSLTSGAVCDEKRNRTLPALLTTPLTAAEIIVGKLVSRIVQLSILVLTAAPILLAVRVFGGVPSDVLLQALALTLIVSIVGAALALMFSVYARKPSAAASGAVLVLTLVNVVPVLALQVLPTATSVRLAEWLMPLCAPVIMFQLTLDILGSTTALPIVSGAMWIKAIAYYGGLAVLATFWAIVRFRSVMRSEEVEKTEPDSVRRARKRARRAAAQRLAESPAPELEAPADPGPESIVLGTDRTVGDRPVFWRELRQPSFKTRTRMLICLGAAVLIALWIYSEADLSRQDIHFSVLVLGTLATVAVAAAQGTGSITSEREGRTWETLLTTPIPPRQILWAKTLGALKAMWFVPVLLFFHFGVVGVGSGFFRPILIPHLVLILLGPVFLMCSTGVFFSLAFKKSISASTCNFLLAGGLWMGLPALYMSVRMAFSIEDSRFWDNIGNAIVAINPVPMAMTAVSGGATDRAEFFNRGFTQPYHIADADLSTLGFTVVTTLIFAGFVVLGALTLELGVAWFKRLGGRSS